MPRTKFKKSRKVANKGMGWRPDLPDHRDKVYKVPLKLASKMPDAINLMTTVDFMPVEDQGSLGSCTGNALVGAMEFIEKKQEEEFTDLSRLFVYYNERLLEGSVNEDAGAYLRDGIKTLYRKGVCPETSWPYVISKFAELPDTSCYREAKSRKIVLYQRINTLDQMRACLATDYPFVFGFTVYDSFMTDQVANTGIVPMPTKDETVQGGHAVLVVGYDDRTKRFTCRNSWGESWGDHGYFTMPYAYLTNRDLSDDFWTIRM